MKETIAGWRKALETVMKSKQIKMSRTALTGKDSSSRVLGSGFIETFLVIECEGELISFKIINDTDCFSCIVVEENKIVFNLSI